MKEIQRIENFNLVKQQLESKGYCGEKFTISIIKANIMAVVTSGPVAVLCCVMFFLINQNGEFKFSILELLLSCGVILASVFVHEFLHGLVWRFYCKNGWKSIHFGVVWKKLTPFCHCTEPLSFGQYILGGLMPFIVLGLGIFVVSLLTNNISLLVLSVFNIIAAGGDITIALMLMNHRNVIFIDHPTECGFWTFNKKV